MVIWIWRPLNSDISICWCQKQGEEAAGLELPPAFVRGLSTARLSGRAQIVHDNGSADTSENLGELTFYLDGAHSPESMEACARWFSGATKANKKLSSLSSPPSTSVDVHNMKSLWGNGCLHYEKDCLKSSNKTSKQVKLLWLSFFWDVSILNCFYEVSFCKDKTHFFVI